MRVGSDAQRFLVVVQLNPHLGEAVKVPAETKTCAGTLEGLGLRAGHRVFIVRPLLAAPAMASDAGDDQRTRHQHLSCLD